MSVYPFEIDSDEELPRVDDDITEIGPEAINALRDAVFNIETELGSQTSSTNSPSGALASLADRLNVSINPNGTIKASALTSVGLATLPIVDNQVATNAGIKEFKLDLDFSTTDLHTLIVANQNIITSLNIFTNDINSNLNNHIGGSSISSLRHVASHIDLNNVPNDVRDSSFNWAGLSNKDGVVRSASTVAEALDQINTDLINHENISSVSPEAAHPASGISVDASNFVEISDEIDNVQDAIDALDSIEASRTSLHRATMHSSGVPKDARARAFGVPDGYRENVVPPTPATTHVAHNPPGTGPVDNTISGDDIVVFNPDNTDFIFDSQFGQVKVGDHVRINYGNGLESITRVHSVRYNPGNEWVLRVAKSNLTDTDSGFVDGYDALVRIDRPLFTSETYGVLAVASANPTPQSQFAGLLGSLIVGHPKGAVALGNGFDPNQIDAEHYLLYLELYPSGNPSEKVISLPAIDVSGNAGSTPGRYTLESIVRSTNNSFRQIGYNYRFIAFSHSSGNFGIMLADPINGAAFAIVSGENSGGSLVEGSFANNAVGNARAENFDALGFGFGKADLAGPAFQTSFVDETAAQLPTKVIVPLKDRDYIVNGRRRDSFAPTYLATPDLNGDGYWQATIINRNQIGTSTVETTYQVDLLLQPAELKGGKTIVVQNSVDFDDPNYNDVDYGRFIIKSVTFDTPGNRTLITVINSIHALGSSVGFTSDDIPVLLYFSEDSVGINSVNIVDPNGGLGCCTAGIDYHRFHEVYITDEGKTFAHERARMPLQSESSSLLNTSKWHISDVSPKFRGYVDSSGIRKYVRLVIFNYVAATGEFDGYIGEIDSSNPTNILRNGIGVTGRKNVPVRFYDDSNIDYIELIFRDSETSPSVGEGDPVMSNNNSNRVVDIEIFSTLSLDDELLKIATCEVNWIAETGTDNIEYVRDYRPHGSISEIEFTQSAKDFIQAGDRSLHSNGVIRGLSFRAQSTNDDRVLFFNGGSAVVDGAIVSVNPDSVTFPSVNAGSSLFSTFDWAVCVDKFGNFVPIPITEDKQQFFASDNASGNDYYIQSVTFEELVSIRKDLTIIAIVGIISDPELSSPFSVTSVSDARRFSTNETLNIPFTWVPEGRSKRESLFGLSGDVSDLEDNLVGHFYSFEAVKTWVNNYGDLNNTIKVRGKHELLSALDFSGITKSVTLDGENAEFVVKSLRGFILGSNLTIKNITFKYDVGIIPSNLVNSGNGALYANVTAGNFIENVTIENCLFYSAGLSNRHPYINVEVSGQSLVSNFVVRNCRFNDTNSSTSIYNSAVAIINTNTTGSNSIPATIIDSVIERNICTGQQNIIISSGANVSGEFVEPGIQAANVKIENNSCGAIGYIVSTTKEINSLITSHFESKSTSINLSISNNNCVLIGNLSADGYIHSTVGASSEPITSTTGHVKIDGNAASWIRCFARSDAVELEPSSLLVHNNILTANIPSVLEVYNEGNNPLITSLDNTAISINGPTNVFALPITSITNNKISPSTISVSGSDVSLFYECGILASFVTSDISHNIISGIKTLSTGSLVDGYGVHLSGGGSASKYDVSYNYIGRGASDIRGYVGVLVFTTDVITTKIVENTFDNPFVNNAFTDDVVIKASNVFAIHERNINQRKTVTISPSIGAHQITSALSYYLNPGGTNSRITSGPTNLIDQARFLYQDAPITGGFNWIVPLSAVIPSGATLVGDITVPYQSDAVPDSSGEISITLTDLGGLIGTINGTAPDFDATAQTAILSVSSFGWNRGGSGSHMQAIQLTGAISDSGSNITVTFGPMTLTYTW